MRNHLPDLFFCKIFGISKNSLLFCIKRRNMDAKISHSIKEYFKTQPIEKAWVFGSFSRREERADSDVDILVSLVPGTRLGLKFFAMNLELEQLLNRPVDLVIEGDLMPFAENTVNQEKVLVYARA